MTNTIEHKRREALAAWLHEIHAIRLTGGKIGESSAHGYSVNDRILIVVEYADGSGFDLYTPVTQSRKVADTFAAAERALEITEESKR